MPTKILVIENLKERHPGLSEGTSLYLHEAARVCLSRHHGAPAQLAVQNQSDSAELVVGWEEPSSALKAAWANQIDTTEAGACCLSLAAVEDQRALVAVARAETGSGADYLLFPKDAGEPEDFESTIRLEISGTDAGSHAVLQGRLTEKLRQAKNGNSDSQAIASVVGFKALTIMIADVDKS